jgi:hypothetical protein
VTNEIGAMETGSYEIAAMEAGVICNWWRKQDIIPGGKKEVQGAFHASDLGSGDRLLMAIDWQHGSDEIYSID